MEEGQPQRLGDEEGDESRSPGPRRKEVGRLLSPEGLYDARNLGEVCPWLFIMGRSNEIRSFVDELARGLFVGIGDPEVVVLGIDVGEVQHLLEMTSDGADQAKLYALRFHGRNPIVLDMKCIDASIFSLAATMREFGQPLVRAPARSGMVCRFVCNRRSALSPHEEAPEHRS